MTVLVMRLCNDNCLSPSNLSTKSKVGNWYQISLERQFARPRSKQLAGSQVNQAKMKRHLESHWFKIWNYVHGTVSCLSLSLSLSLSLHRDLHDFICQNKNFVLVQALIVTISFA